MNPAHRLLVSVACSAALLVPPAFEPAVAEAREVSRAGPLAGVAPAIERLEVSGVARSALAAAAEASPKRQAQPLRDSGLDASQLDEQPEVVADLPAARPFDAVGISWDRTGEDPPAVWVRAFESARWSAWSLLPVLDLAPDDGGSPDVVRRDRTFSEPLLTKGASRLQVRIDADSRLRNVRADLIDAGTAPGDQALPPASAAPPTHRGRAAALPTRAAASRPPIITRSQWGADETLRSSDPAYASSIKVGVVHHTATSNSYGASNAAAQIRSIYAYHTMSLGWSDIAYNFLVDRDGRVFEGRFGGVDRPVIGAATGGFNTSTFSVSALGSFDDGAPPGGMVESIAQVMAWKFAVHYVNPLGRSLLTSGGASSSRYPAGAVVTVDNVMAHRDTNFTACPGAQLYGRLGAIRARIKELLPAGLVHPSITTTHRTPSSNGSVRVTSGFLYGGNWSATITSREGAFIRRYVGTGQSMDLTWPMVTENGAAVPEGTYRVELSAEQNGQRAAPYGQWISTSSFTGNFESVRLTTGGVVGTGWAAVSNGDTATVALVIDGTTIVRAPAAGSRPDVGSALPHLGSARGFSAALPMGVGRHLVCAWAEGAGLQSRLLGCHRFNNPPDEPFGNVEATSSLYGGVRVSGWMLDRQTSAPITARFYVDGAHGGDRRASQRRPDVAAAYPGYGAEHGFTAELRTGPGLHSVCVNGLNVGAGSSEGHLGCVFAAPITGPPIGNFELLRVAEGSVSVVGWTFDPDTSNPTSVHVYVDGSYRGALTAGSRRPDLAGPFPFMGIEHGFDGTVGTSTTGSHTVCVYAINVGSPAANPSLGCRTFG